MTVVSKMEVSVQGMDCAECTLHVQKAIAALPGVRSVDVFLASEKAVVQLDPQQVGLNEIHKAVEGAGYTVLPLEDTHAQPMDNFTRAILRLLVVVFGAVLFIAVVGEWLGFFETATELIPWPVWLVIILAGGYPVFRNVIRAALNRQVIAHTLMTVGVMAAVAVGEWATAAVVVLLMRVGDYVERFTTERARRAVKDLTALAPQTARLEQNGVEVEVPVAQVSPGQTVVVRPGERIPVDGEVTAGFATVDQASITGEPMPVEAGPGARVFAATLVRLGSLRVRATQVGADSTFGRIIKLVEEAEMHRANVQRIADKFSAYYLPVVAGVALATLLFRRDPLATAAVLVVACSCSFALATPIAMLASIGASAQRGVLIKGGKYLELLSRADVLLIDKTGTLTLGKPCIVDYRDLPTGLGSPRYSRSDILRLAGTAERYSEHPLAEAIRQEAFSQAVSLDEPVDFVSLPGMGVRAMALGHEVAVGNRRMFELALEHCTACRQIAEELEAQGKTLIFVALDGELVALFAAADRLRPEVPQALAMAHALGLRQIELLTGDNLRSATSQAAGLVNSLGIRVRANLLPEDKIQVVKEYQSQGRIVVMVGDGVNDAPALAQADVGIAMGAAGSDVAIEAAHIALMRDDWRLVPESIRIARRTMKVVKLNIAFTTVYNILGVSLAALGYLPPILAASAQSLPDLGILANSSRLLRQKS
jgi:Cd2+/Zn2+-exporting ATPase/Cu+-exporting ATPase